MGPGARQEPERGPEELAELAVARDRARDQARDQAQEQAQDRARHPHKALTRARNPVVFFGALGRRAPAEPAAHAEEVSAAWAQEAEVSVLAACGGQAPAAAASRRGARKTKTSWKS